MIENSTLLPKDFYSFTEALLFLQKNGAMIEDKQFKELIKEEKIKVYLNVDNKKCFVMQYDSDLAKKIAADKENLSPSVKAHLELRRKYKLPDSTNYYYSSFYKPCVKGAPVIVGFCTLFKGMYIIGLEEIYNILENQKISCSSLLSENFFTIPKITSWLIHPHIPQIYTKEEICKIESCLKPHNYSEDLNIQAFDLYNDNKYFNLEDARFSQSELLETLKEIKRFNFNDLKNKNEFNPVTEEQITSFEAIRRNTKLKHDSCEALLEETKSPIELDQSITEAPYPPHGNDNFKHAFEIFFSREIWSINEALYFFLGIEHDPKGLSHLDKMSSNQIALWSKLKTNFCEDLVLKKVIIPPTKQIRLLDDEYNIIDFVKYPEDFEHLSPGIVVKLVRSDFFVCKDEFIKWYIKRVNTIPDWLSKFLTLKNAENSEAVGKNSTEKPTWYENPSPKMIEMANKFFPLISPFIEKAGLNLQVVYVQEQAERGDCIGWLANRTHLSTEQAACILCGFEPPIHLVTDKASALKGMPEAVKKIYSFLLEAIAKNEIVVKDGYAPIGDYIQWLVDKNLWDLVLPEELQEYAINSKILDPEKFARLQPRGGIRHEWVKNIPIECKDTIPEIFAMSELCERWNLHSNEVMKICMESDFGAYFKLLEFQEKMKKIGGDFSPITAQYKGLLRISKKGDLGSLISLREGQSLKEISLEDSDTCLVLDEERKLIADNLFFVKSEILNHEVQNPEFLSIKMNNVNKENNFMQASWPSEKAEKVAESTMTKAAIEALYCPPAGKTWDNLLKNGGRNGLNEAKVKGKNLYYINLLISLVENKYGKILPIRETSPLGARAVTRFTSKSGLS